MITIKITLQNYYKQRQMSETERPTKLTLKTYKQIYKKNVQEKLLQQALVFLKLRQKGCPKSKAMIFAKKKQVAIDGTAVRDGPAGFRQLRPYKPEGMMVNGWLKRDKLRYHGTRGVSEEVKKCASKERTLITKVHRQGRNKFEDTRLKYKQQQLQKQFLVHPAQHKKLIEQIISLKDQFLKDREKRNLFLSFQGVRLDQYTRDFFDRIQDEDPESLIVKLGAFNTPINNEQIKIQTDWQIAKGRSLSSYEIQGQSKRKQVLDFRKSLTNLQLPRQKGPSMASQKKFRSTLHNSNKKQMTTKLRIFSSSLKKQKIQKQFDEFYDHIDKVAWIKSKQAQMDDKQEEQIRLLFNKSMSPRN